MYQFYESADSLRGRYGMIAFLIFIATIFTHLISQTYKCITNNFNPFVYETCGGVHEKDGMLSSLRCVRAFICNGGEKM